MRDYPVLDGKYCYHLDRPLYRDDFPCDTMYFRRDADPDQLDVNGAVELIAARVARGNTGRRSAGKRRGGAKKK